MRINKRIIGIGATGLLALGVLVGAGAAYERAGAEEHPYAMLDQYQTVAAPETYPYALSDQYVIPEGYFEQLAMERMGLLGNMIEDYANGSMHR